MLCCLHRANFRPLLGFSDTLSYGDDFLVSARLWYLHCQHTGDTVVLYAAIDGMFAWMECQEIWTFTHYFLSGIHSSMAIAWSWLTQTPSLTWSPNLCRRAPPSSFLQPRTPSTSFQKPRRLRVWRHDMNRPESPGGFGHDAVILTIRKPRRLHINSSRSPGGGWVHGVIVSTTQWPWRFTTLTTGQLGSLATTVAKPSCPCYCNSRGIVGMIEYSVIDDKWTGSGILWFWPSFDPGS